MLTFFTEGDIIYKICIVKYNFIYIWFGGAIQI